MYRKSWQWGLFGLVWLVVPGGIEPIEARPVPDGTLGGERSTVTEGTIRGIPSDRIGGGATRGQNLFHSFESFNVEAGRGAYFDNPAGIENIFSRVTGGSRSDINGRLGVIQAGSGDVLGSANLFFMNPNGIVFGPGAQLDVGGSFVGTTANAIGFGEQGFFSVVDQTAPPLLTVNPSAFLFSQVNPSAEIVNQSRANAGTDPSNSFSTFGLRVPNGYSLLLLGGDININGGGIIAFGGRADLGGVVGIGVVGLTVDANDLRLRFPEGIARANVSLTNRGGDRAGIITAGDNAGSININARSITLSGGSIVFAGIGGNLGSVDSQAGDITFNTTEAVSVSGSSFVYNYLDSNALGSGGNIVVEARQLLLRDGGQIAALNFGTGRAGSIIIDAVDSVSLNGGEFNLPTGLYNLVGVSGNGNAGDLRLNTRNLSVSNGSQISISTFGRGNAGRITLDVRERIILDGSQGNTLIENDIASNAEGDTGGIRINTGSLSIIDGSQITAIVRGEGHTGDIVIEAENGISLIGNDFVSNTTFLPSAIFARVEGAGNSGNIIINAASLELADRAQIAATTGGMGSPGDIQIDVAGRTSLLNSTIISEVTEATGEGQGGDITIRADSLELRDGSALLADTENQGDAGDITIEVRGDVILSGRGPSALNSDVIVPSQITTTVESEAVGEGGDIQIIADSLQVLDDGFIRSRTEGQGSAGNITIDTGSLTRLEDGSAIDSNTSSQGRAGDIEIETRDLNVRNSTISASTSSSGNAGTLSVRASGSIDLSGENLDARDGVGSPGGLFAQVELGGTGNGGDLFIEAGQLAISDGSKVQVATFGEGNAGTLLIEAGEINILDTPISNRYTTGISSGVEIDPLTVDLPSGEGNNLTIRTNRLNINGGRISASTSGLGNAGNLDIQVFGSIELTGSDSLISTAVNQNAIGEAGNIIINAETLNLNDRASITSSTSGQGNTGTINVQTTERISLINNSSISSTVNAGATGNSRQITLQTPNLSLTDSSQISAATSSTGNPGTIVVQNANSIALDNSTISSEIKLGATATQPGSIDLQAHNLTLNNNARLTASTSGQGTAGNIMIRDAQTVTATNSQISTAVEQNAIGQGGNITLNTNALNLADRSQINSSTSGTGDTGTIAIQANDRISLTNNSQISSTVNRGASGNSQNIVLATPEVTLQQNSQISAATDGAGQAGSITIRGTEVNRPAEQVSIDNSTISTQIQPNGVVDTADPQQSNITIQTRLLNLDRANIIASTQGQGRAGNIIVQDADRVSLDQNSTISTAVGETGIGQGGNITLNTNSLNLTDRSEITSNTSGQGNAGNIRIQGAETVTLNNDSAVTTAVRRGADGNGGDIEIETDRLRLDDSVISSSTAGTGSTGRVTVNASDRITLRNQSRIDNRVEQGAIGDSRTIRLETDSLRLDSSQITASTNGRGRAGDIAISNANTIDLDDNSTISSAVRQNGRGRAGSVTVRNAQTLSLNNGSGISTAVNQGGRGRGGNIQIDTNALTLDNNTVINAQTRGRGRAGDITIDTNQIEATQGGRLTSSTNTNRPAGTITLRALDRITLNGSNSRISANTTRSGRGGRIDLQTQQLDLNNGAMISSTSQGSGTAGNIRITASELLQSAGGNITTRANRSTGGDITLTGGDIDLSRGSSIRTDVDRGSGNGGDIAINADTVRLQDNSDIQTRVGETGTGDGGNITITADSVIAFDDSDLITEAPNLGGDITLNTPVFFGAGYQANVSTADNPDGNGRVDLDASGEVSAGAVQTPDTSFIQNSLSDLPDSAIDTEALLANSCIARTENSGTFLITGSGGLPPNRPGIAPLSPYPTETVRSTPEESSWQPGDPIVEPQGVYRLPNGELVMMHECSQS